MKDIKFLKEQGVNVDASVELFGDITMYNETMNDYIDGIDVKLERLKTSKAAGDLQNYAIFAHSVKSDARYLGFESVAAIALKHEMAGKEGDQKLIVDNYDELISAVNNMTDIVKKYLTEEPDAVISGGLSSKGTILVVDDSPLITNLINKTLNEKYNVIVFNSGKEVKDYIENNKEGIDILLLDLNMPDVNGFDILEYMKAENIFKNIKVSIISGDESEATIAKAFTYPIVDMLNKPFSVTDLQNVVTKTLER